MKIWNQIWPPLVAWYGSGLISFAIGEYCHARLEKRPIYGRSVILAFTYAFLGPIIFLIAVALYIVEYTPIPDWIGEFLDKEIWRP